jgi:hypothetical protein
VGKAVKTWCGSHFIKTLMNDDGESSSGSEDRYMDLETVLLMVQSKKGSIQTLRGPVLGPA